MAKCGQKKLPAVSLSVTDRDAGDHRRRR